MIASRSDGQSIPFGRNWISEIEDALVAAKLMFVFITPNSITSRWVPFEAGHAYGRRIQVVPVGMLGVDIGAVGAPLSLLQGFNVENARGLGNIVAVCNKAFDFQHPTVFSDAEYDAVVAPESGRSVPGKYIALVDDVSFALPGTQLRRSSAAEALQTLAAIAAERKIACTVTGAGAHMPGVTVTLQGYRNVSGPGGGSAEQYWLDFRIDPGSLFDSEGLLNGFLRSAMTAEVSAPIVNLRFIPSVRAVTDRHKVTGRLRDDGVVPTGLDEQPFRWHDLTFRVDDEWGWDGDESRRVASYINISFQKREIDVAEVMRLIDLLFGRRSLSIGPS